MGPSIEQWFEIESFHPFTVVTVRTGGNVNLGDDITAVFAFNVRAAGTMAAFAAEIAHLRGFLKRNKAAGLAGAGRVSGAAFGEFGGGQFILEGNELLIGMGFLGFFGKTVIFFEVTADAAF